MWNEKQCLITVFIICSGRQLILYYDTHRLFFVSNHLTILLQAIAKVLHFCSFSSFPMEITSSEYWLWYSRIFSIIIPREKRSVDPEGHLFKLLYSIWSGIWIPDQVRDDKWNTFQQSQNYSDLQLKILLKIIDWSVNQKNTDNICIILIWWLLSAAWLSTRSLTLYCR
jgi:hypothetical protein